LVPSEEYNTGPGAKQDDSALLQDTPHPSIEHWIEAQIAQSSELLALFQEQELWLSETADNLAHRRKSEDQDGDSLAVLEEEEALQRSTMSHLEAKVASLTFRANTAETLEEEPAVVRSHRPAPKGWRLQDLARNATTTHPGLLNKSTAVSKASVGAAVRARSESMRQARSASETEQGLSSIDSRQARQRFSTTSSTKSGKSNAIPEQKWNLRRMQHNVRGSPAAGRAFTRQ